MITKERINELIDNQKTIYFVDWTYKKVESVKLTFADIYSHDSKLIVSDNNKSVIWRLELSKLFETEEDARWELEMTATRTETLRLPTYKQVCDMIYSSKVYGVLTIKTFDKITFGYKRQINDNVYYLLID